MAGPYLEFDLGREIQQLHEEDTWSTGRNSKTLVKYADFRVVLMALKAGMRVEKHQAEGRISVQTIAGHINIRASGRTFDLPTGSRLALDRATVHDVEALEESAVLLTIAWPEEIKGQQATR
jgi:quercetin dioxygenase-like cupin family protein